VNVVFKNARYIVSLLHIKSCQIFHASGWTSRLTFLSELCHLYTDLWTENMGSCLSAASASSSTSCSIRDEEFYEWKIAIQKHRINQLIMRLRRWEEAGGGGNVGMEGRDPGKFPSKTVLFGIAGRYGGSDIVQDTPQVLRDLSVLNYYQRCVLDNLAWVPECQAPRVCFK
jgi:hypothetical protein